MRKGILIVAAAIGLGAYYNQLNQTNEAIDRAETCWASVDAKAPAFFEARVQQLESTADAGD